MSQNPTEAPNTVDPAQGSQAGTSAEQPAKTLMLYWDPMYNQWMMLPQFRAQFEMQLYIIEELRQIINSKWT